MAQPSVVYFAVSLASALLFLMIFLIKIPELYRALKRMRTQMAARRDRKDELLADPEQMLLTEVRLEGIYRFENIEPHSSPESSEIHHQTPASRSMVPSETSIPELTVLAR